MGRIIRACLQKCGNPWGLKVLPEVRYEGGDKRLVSGVKDWM